MHRIWRGSLAAVATGLLAVAAIGLPAQAMPPPLTVTFQAVPDDCVQGTSNGAFDLELRSHDNSTKLDEVLGVAPSSGHWSACFLVDFVSSGKRLRATSGTGVVSYTVPTLTVDTDRITDVVNGTGVAGHQVKIRLYDCNHLDFACVHKATRTVTLSSAGHYSKDMSSAFDTRGFDEARVTDTNSAGHSFTVTTIFPWLAVVPTDDQVFGESRGGQKVTIRLYSAPGGTLLTKRSKVVPFADFNFFLNSHTSTGRQVTAGFASDAKLTIPSTHISTEVVGTDTILYVRCLRDRPVMVDFNPGVDRIYHTDTHGRVDVNVTQDAPGVDLSVDGVRLTCQSAAGDVIARYYPAPIP